MAQNNCICIYCGNLTSQTDDVFWPLMHCEREECIGKASRVVLKLIQYHANKLLF